jgi:hypothetical protein
MYKEAKDLIDYKNIIFDLGGVILNLDYNKTVEEFKRHIPDLDESVFFGKEHQLSFFSKYEHLLFPLYFLIDVIICLDGKCTSQFKKIIKNKIKYFNIFFKVLRGHPRACRLKLLVFVQLHILEYL